jgi:hypothetical protein
MSNSSEYIIYGVQFAEFDSNSLIRFSCFFEVEKSLLEFGLFLRSVTFLYRADLVSLTLWIDSGLVRKDLQIYIFGFYSVFPRVSFGILP